MKIIGVLSWYDESAIWLSAVVAGMGQFCDAVVACDGGYSLFPGARPRSMPEQTEAILWAAEAANLECIIHRPKDVFRGGEVEKRNQTLALAGTLCEPDEGWVCVMDGDMHLMKCNRDAVRWDLEHTDCDVATMTVLSGKDMLADADLEAASRILELDHEWTEKTRLIYRWHPSLRYGPKHWWVTRKRGRKVEWLWGPSEGNELAPCVDLLGNLVTYHRTDARAFVRRKAAANYYEIRDAYDAEAGTIADAVTSHSGKQIVRGGR